MATVTRVEQAGVVALFAALGKPEAAKWSAKKLAINLANINDLVTDDTTIEDGEANSLLEHILTAQAKGQTVEVGDTGAQDESTSKETEAEAPKRAKKGTGTTAKKESVRAKKKNTSKVDKSTKLKSRGTGVGRGYRIMSYSSTGVIHWMAANKFDFDKAKKVLKHFKITDITDSNLKSRLAVGRDPARSKAATLTKDEARQIKALVS